MKSSRFDRLSRAVLRASVRCTERNIDAMYLIVSDAYAFCRPHVCKFARTTAAACRKRACSGCKCIHQRIQLRCVSDAHASNTPSARLIAFKREDCASGSSIIVAQMMRSLLCSRFRRTFTGFENLEFYLRHFQHRCDVLSTFCGGLHGLAQL